MYSTDTHESQQTQQNRQIFAAFVILAMVGKWDAHAIEQSKPGCQDTSLGYLAMIRASQSQFSEGSLPIR